jgi:putative transposase
MARDKKAMPTIWQVSDDLWSRIKPIIEENDPPKATGRKRVDARLVLDTLIFRLRTGCHWNQLPERLADDSSAHRTMQRWIACGVFDAIWAELLAECDELGGVDWAWQAADGALGKSRFGGTKSAPTPPTAARPA